MKTEDRKVGEAGCAPVYWEVPATHKMGDAMGRPSGRSSLLEGSWCEIFLWKTRGRCKPRGDGPRRTNQSVRFRPTFTGTDPESARRRKLWEVFDFLFFLHSRAGRSGPQRSRARRFLARRSAPLTARTTARESAMEEKTCSQECKT